MPLDKHGRFVHYGLDHTHPDIEMNKAGITINSIIFYGLIGYSMYLIAKNRTDHLKLENRTRNTFQQTATYHNEHTHRQTPNYEVNNRMPLSPFDSDYSSGQDITKARGVF